MRHRLVGHVAGAALSGGIASWRRIGRRHGRAREGLQRLEDHGADLARLLRVDGDVLEDRAERELHRGGFGGQGFRFLLLRARP